MHMYKSGARNLILATAWAYNNTNTNSGCYTLAYIKQHTSLKCRECERRHTSTARVSMQGFEVAHTTAHRLSEVPPFHTTS